MTDPPRKQGWKLHDPPPSIKTWVFGFLLLIQFKFKKKKKRLDKGYPQTFIKNLLSEIKFTKRESKLLKQNNKEGKEILPFVTQYQPSLSTIKEVE